MAAPKAPMLDANGKRAKDVTLDEGVFAGEVKVHLVHEAAYQFVLSRVGEHLDAVGVEERAASAGGAPYQAAMTYNPEASAAAVT